jgi:hypothetical protein
MSGLTQNKLNSLLQKGLPGGLYFSEWLNRQGYSKQLLNKYRESGWLSSLGRGVMFRANEKLSAYSALSNYNYQIGKNIRVAAHSALELNGFNHYVPMGKPILMVTSPDKQFPKWLYTDKFDQTIKTFTTDTFSDPLTITSKVGNIDVLMSVPEQAFAECLLLAPNQYSYMDLYHIMEQLTSLRPEMVQKILESTKSIKVKRMFLYMAEKAEHYWFSSLDISKIELGTSKIQLTRGGVYISKCKITIPKELNDYE